MVYNYNNLLAQVNSVTFPGFSIISLPLALLESSDQISFLEVTFCISVLPSFLGLFYPTAVSKTLKLSTQVNIQEFSLESYGSMSDASLRQTGHDWVDFEK